jgi:hypothetical protein
LIFFDGDDGSQTERVRLFEFNLENIGIGKSHDKRRRRCCCCWERFDSKFSEEFDEANDDDDEVVEIDGE